jgi:hypothetical protein
MDEGEHLILVLSFRLENKYSIAQKPNHKLYKVAEPTGDLESLNEVGSIESGDCFLCLISNQICRR